MTSERQYMIINFSWFQASCTGKMTLFVECFMRNTNQEKIVHLFRWLHELEEYELIENLYNWMGEYIEHLYGCEHEDPCIVKRICKRLSNIRKWLEAVNWV